MHMCGYEHMSVGVPRGKKRTSDELPVTVFVVCRKFIDFYKITFNGVLEDGYMFTPWGCYSGR